MILVVEKALRILEYLGENPSKTASLSEIAGAMGMDRGTCTHILKTLCAQGFVQQEAPRSGYQLGYKLYHLTGKAVDNEELTAIARRDVDALAAELNETAMLVIARNDKRVVLYNTVPNRSIVVRTDMERSIYSACAGRVILAYYTPSHLDKCLIRMGLPSRDEWPEIYLSEHPEQELIDTLARIKMRGYDIQYDTELTGFAAPLFMDGHVKGSIGTYLPKDRVGDEERIIRPLLHYAGEINRKLASMSLAEQARGK